MFYVVLLAAYGSFIDADVFGPAARNKSTNVTVRDVAAIRTAVGDRYTFRGVGKCTEDEQAITGVYTTTNSHDECRGRCSAADAVCVGYDFKTITGMCGLHGWSATLDTTPQPNAALFTKVLTAADGTQGYKCYSKDSDYTPIGHSLCQVLGGVNPPYKTLDVDVDHCQEACSDHGDCIGFSFNPEKAEDRSDIPHPCYIYGYTNDFIIEGAGASGPITMVSSPPSVWACYRKKPVLSSGWPVWQYLVVVGLPSVLVVVGVWYVWTHCHTEHASAGELDQLIL